MQTDDSVKCFSCTFASFLAADERWQYTASRSASCCFIRTDVAFRAVWKQLEHENPQFFLVYKSELAKRCSWLQGKAICWRYSRVLINCLCRAHWQLCQCLIAELGTTSSCKGLDTLGQAECWSRPWQSPTLWSPVTRHRVFFLLLLLLIIWLACTAQQDKVPIIKQMTLYCIPMMALLLIHLCSNCSTGQIVSHFLMCLLQRALTQCMTAYYWIDTLG